MGSFLGHLLPGSFFILFSIRWLFVILSTFYNAERRKGKDEEEEEVFKSRTTFSFRCCPLDGRNYEAWVKVTCCLVGFTGEFITGFDSSWTFVNYGNSQHMAMFLFFAMNGLTEVIMYRDESRTRLAKGSRTYHRLPPGTDYLSVLVAVFVEGLLFAFHLHGRSALDIHVHQLLIITIGATFLSVANEWKHRNNILAAVFRSLCFLIQGTWFIQIGFILYNPLPGAVPWPDHDHRQMMLVTTLFCIHLGVDILIAVLIGYWMNKSSCASYYSSYPMSSNGKHSYQDIPYSECPLEVTTTNCE